jgi:hypothetical protein
MFVIGGRVRTVEHWQQSMRGKVRVITQVNATFYKFIHEGEPNRVYRGEYQKASQVEFDGKKANVQLDEARQWVLEFL